jgi:hypothetical protein
MDAWKFGSAEKWQEDVERRGREAQALAQSQGMKLRREASRTFKREIKAFKEFVKSGGNPHLIAQHWDRVKELE